MTHRHLRVHSIKGALSALSVHKEISETFRNNRCEFPLGPLFFQYSTFLHLANIFQGLLALSLPRQCSMVLRSLYIFGCMEVKGEGERVCGDRLVGYE